MDTLIYVVAQLAILALASYITVVLFPLVRYVSALRAGRPTRFSRADLVEAIKHPIRVVRS